MTEIKTEKFIFQDFPKNSVANKDVTDIQDQKEVEHLVNEVVTEHIAKITLDSNQEDVGEPLKEQSKKDEHSLLKTEEEVKVIMEAEYQRGLADGIKSLEEKNEKDAKETAFLELFQEKVSLIEPKQDVSEQIAKMSAEAISGIARKLHLILPVNFSEIITRGLIEKLSNFYKEGSVLLTVHPSKHDFCVELLKLDSLPDKLKGNVKIEKNDKLDEDDCNIEYLETRLEYSKKQLSEEVDKIIEQLKSMI